MAHIEDFFYLDPGVQLKSGSEPSEKPAPDPQVWFLSSDRCFVSFNGLLSFFVLYFFLLPLFRTHFFDTLPPFL